MPRLMNAEGIAGRAHHDMNKQKARRDPHCWGIDVLDRLAVAVEALHVLY